MGMNPTELHDVVQALQRLVGMWFDNAWQPSRDRVLLGLRDPEQSERLLLVPRGPFARMHTVARRPDNPSTPFSFQGALRAHVHGRLQRLSVVEGERVVELHFSGTWLHLRLTGRSGGLWLCSPERVLAAFDGPAPAALPPLPDHQPRQEASRFTGPDADLAARRWFERREADARASQRLADLSRGLRTERKKLDRLVQGLERDLEAADGAEILRRKADALAARLHEVKPGRSEVTLPDLAEPDHHWTISLDPGRPPHVTLDKMYSRAGRLERAGEQVLERLEEAQERQGLLGRLQQSLEQAPEPEVLDAIAELLPERKGQQQATTQRRPWKVWRRSRDGQEVWIGNNARTNHLLTFHAARGWDWWMHVRERPGPHVIVPSPRNSVPPLELLLDAAALGLLAGREPAGELVDVQYTRVKHLRTVPGELGRTQVLDERVLAVEVPSAPPEGWELVTVRTA